MPISLLVYDFDGKFKSFHRQIPKFFATLFATLIPRTCKCFFNSETFTLTKIGSISSTAIALKDFSCKQHKTASTFVYFAAKDFILHKPHLLVTFFARPRVTGNTKLDYSQH